MRYGQQHAGEATDAAFKASPEHKKYPYLLRNMVIDRPDQV
jgi:hypothetical protein